MPIGSFVNAATVILGSAIGLLVSHRLPERIKAIIFQAVGLGTLVLGMQMAFEVQNFVTFIFSLILGGIIGELVHLETRLNAMGDWLKARIRSDNARFTEGLVTAFLIFCVGSMTIMGALNEGLTGDRSLILTKAVLDGFTSIVLASVYGVGVMFTALPLFLVQSSLTLLATSLSAVLAEAMIAQLTAVGGALVLGIGLNLLEIKEIKTVNLLPGLLVVLLLTALWG